MSTLIVVLITVVALVSAYRIYGSYLAEKIFQLNDGRLVPSRELEDRIDFVPTRKSVVFGHHFTSIAGTGPIVGPALAVFWGWLPALLWVILGGIFVGAVHDFGSLVVSLRNRGETIGQVAGRLISKRTRLLFLLILFFALTVVLGIFGLVVAQVFQLYPSSVLGTWISLPLAVLFGWLARKGKTASWFLLMAMMLVIYGSVWLGAYHMQILLEPEKWWAMMVGETVPNWVNSVVLWTIILLVYCYFASVMPVSFLLQPRDYLNSWQLIIALSVLVGAICYAGVTHQADLVASAPAMVAANEMPAGAPPMFPFLFITIACGAVSGFHCLVSSGTTSKQVAKESDSQAIGFGSMLLESGLAVTVILACCAGIGMGLFQRTEITDAAGKTRYQFVARDNMVAVGIPVASEEFKGPSTFAAWRERYDSSRSWNDYRMAETVGAFVDGGASFLTVFKLPLVLGQAVLAVLVACFAATTLDSATRLQRYVIQELGTNLKLKPLENKQVATGVAVGLAAMIALMPSSSGGPGTGGTVLWPLFGATNQLLAGLAFLVILFYLWRRGIPVHFLVLPLVLMAVMPLWALGYQLFGPYGFLVAGKNQNWVLGSIGVATMALQLWMFAEALWLLPKVRGLREAMSESKSVVK
jgi:carbon starvation protein